VLRPLALVLAVAAASLAGCDDTRPPPGEVIGAFQFVAELDDDDAAADGRCDLPESPQDLRFDAVLSYEPTPRPDGSKRFWIQILGSPGGLREGRLDGTRFVTRSPLDPDRVPRSLDACRLDDDGDGVPDRTRCTLGFAEFIEGDLLAQVPADGCTEAALADCESCQLPPNGTDKLAPVGGVCGEVVQDVVPEPPADACFCTGGDGTVAPAAPCLLVYRLKGVLS
jgi:hypothetical protein